MKYLDEVNPNDLTDEQRAQLNQLYIEDPYKFYSLWRDPSKAQVWAEGEGFKTEPVNRLYEKIGALKLAGAPQNVIDFWKNSLEHKNRPVRDNVFDSELPPKTEPVVERLAQIDELCKYLDSQLNYEESFSPTVENDFPDELPFAEKWSNIMKLIDVEHEVGGDNGTGNEIDFKNFIIKHHGGDVSHHKVTDDDVDASMGLEVVEIVLEPEMTFEVDCEEWRDKYVVPDALSVGRTPEGKSIIKLEFFDCYT